MKVKQVLVLLVAFTMAANLAAGSPPTADPPTTGRTPVLTEGYTVPPALPTTTTPEGADSWMRKSKTKLLTVSLALNIFP